MPIGTINMASTDIDVTTIKNAVDIIGGVVDNLPDIDSAANLTMRDVIGDKLDDVAGNSLYALIKTLNEHFHSASKVYPTLANGVVVTGAAGAWALGNFVVIVPTNAIQSVFDIHHINVATFNANDTFELVLYAGANGAEVEIGRCRFTRLSNVGASPHIPMMTPLIAANTQIKAKIASQAGTSNTATISIQYHTY